MRRMNWLLALVALGGANTAAAQQRQALPSNEAIATSMRRSLPQDFGQGFWIVDARAEGRTLVVTASPPRQLTPAAHREVATRLTAGFCSPPNGFFQQGRLLRVDLRSSQGQVQRGVPIARCPGR